MTTEERRARASCLNCSRPTSVELHQHGRQASKLSCFVNFLVIDTLCGKHSQSKSIKYSNIPYIKVDKLKRILHHKTPKSTLSYKTNALPHYQQRGDVIIGYLFAYARRVHISNWLRNKRLNIMMGVLPAVGVLPRSPYFWCLMIKTDQWLCLQLTRVNFTLWATNVYVSSWQSNYCRRERKRRFFTKKWP